MCLAVPMRVKTVHEDGSGMVEMDGVGRVVMLSLVEDPAPGEFVIVHAGFAIEKLDEDEALIRLELFREMARKWNESQEAERGS
ncbi:MAG: HypC/HybG/HupF family hydrogenase formation chaperone [Alphaproteobacteria bacterium]